MTDVIAAMRRDYERALADDDDTEARTICSATVARCHIDAVPPPEWLVAAVDHYVMPADGPQQRDNETNLIDYMMALATVTEGTDEPKMRHFKMAAEALSREGRPISEHGVKKAYQRLVERELDLTIFRVMKKLPGTD